MELHFPRRHIFNTTFVTTDSTGASKPVYRITTTRKWAPYSVITTINYVGDEDVQKHRVVAQILWNWPSQNRSYVHFCGYLYTLNQFLGRAPGFLNTESYITFDNETYTWRTAKFEPQLYDSQGRQVVKYTREPCGLFKLSKNSPLGHLNISSDIAKDQMSLDAVFTSFLIFKATRDFCFPRFWTKKQPEVKKQEEQKEQTQPPQQSEQKEREGEIVPLTRAATNSKGDYVQLASEQ